MGVKSIFPTPIYLLKRFTLTFHKRVPHIHAKSVSRQFCRLHFKKERFESDKMTSFVKSNRKCVRIHYKCIIEILFNSLFNIFCMFLNRCEHIPKYVDSESIGKHIISSAFNCYFIVSRCCLLTSCKSIFNYLPLCAPKPKYDEQSVRLAGWLAVVWDKMFYLFTVAN